MSSARPQQSPGGGDQAGSQQEVGGADLTVQDLTELDRLREELGRPFRQLTALMVRQGLIEPISEENMGSMREEDSASTLGDVAGPTPRRKSLGTMEDVRKMAVETYQTGLQMRELQETPQQQENERVIETLEPPLDSADRRRRNMLAQERYRQIVAERKKALLQPVTKQEIKELGIGDIVEEEGEAEEEVSEPASPEESATIKCVCGFSDDKRHIVQCEKCGRWQHIACYYETIHQIVEVHECVDCSPWADADIPLMPGKRAIAPKKDRSSGGPGSLTGDIQDRAGTVDKSSTGMWSKSEVRSIGDITAATSEPDSIAETRDQSKLKTSRRKRMERRAKLELEFTKNPRPTLVERKRIGQDVDLSERAVQVWFQNRRARIKDRLWGSVEGSVDYNDIPESMQFPSPQAMISGMAPDKIPYMCLAAGCQKRLHDLNEVHQHWEDTHASKILLLDRQSVPTEFHPATFDEDDDSTDSKRGPMMQFEGLPTKGDSTGKPTSTQVVFLDGHLPCDRCQQDGRDCGDYVKNSRWCGACRQSESLCTFAGTLSRTALDRYGRCLMFEKVAPVDRNSKSFDASSGDVDFKVAKDESRRSPQQSSPTVETKLLPEPPQSQSPGLEGPGLTENFGAKGGLDPSSITRKQVAPTGCLTCRKRRIRCGEERPTCANCIMAKRQCEGYNQRVIFKPPIGDWPTHTGIEVHSHTQEEKDEERQMPVLDASQLPSIHYSGLLGGFGTPATAATPSLADSSNMSGSETISGLSTPTIRPADFDSTETEALIPAFIENTDKSKDEELDLATKRELDRRLHARDQKAKNPMPAAFLPDDEDLLPVRIEPLHVMPTGDTGNEIQIKELHKESSALVSHQNTPSVSGNRANKPLSQLFVRSGNTSSHTTVSNIETQRPEEDWEKLIIWDGEIYDPVFVNIDSSSTHAPRVKVGTGKDEAQNLKLDEKQIEAVMDQKLKAIMNTAYRTWSPPPSPNDEVNSNDEVNFQDVDIYSTSVSRWGGSSVGTSIGNQTDDTEYTSTSYSNRSHRSERQLKRGGSPGVRGTLEVLEEESSDEEQYGEETGRGLRKIEGEMGKTSFPEIRHRIKEEMEDYQSSKMSQQEVLKIPLDFIQSIDEHRIRFIDGQEKIWTRCWLRKLSELERMISDANGQDAGLLRNRQALLEEKNKYLKRLAKGKLEYMLATRKLYRDEENCLRHKLQLASNYAHGAPGGTGAPGRRFRLTVTIEEWPKENQSGSIEAVEPIDVSTQHSRTERNPQSTGAEQPQSPDTSTERTAENPPLAWICHLLGEMGVDVVDLEKRTDDVLGGKIPIRDFMTGLQWLIEDCQLVYRYEMFLVALYGGRRPRTHDIMKTHEKKLLTLLAAQALELEHASLYLYTNFFSLVDNKNEYPHARAALNLASMAHQQNIRLSLNDIVYHPVLTDMASRASFGEPEQRPTSIHFAEAILSSLKDLAQPDSSSDESLDMPEPRSAAFPILGEAGSRAVEPEGESSYATDSQSLGPPESVVATVPSSAEVSAEVENAALEAATESCSPMSTEELPEPHLFAENQSMLDLDWEDVRKILPESWMWDVEFHPRPRIDGKDDGCWTCTPTEPDDPKNFPLTISGAPVVLPVEYQWPPMAGVNPPPDPRPSAPIDCTAELPLEVVRDIFLTFEGSLGFYFLINGLLQVIVPEEFDMTWASSHLPHKYGGLKVCYINQTMEPTMFQIPVKTETMKSRSSHASQSSSLASIFKSSKSSGPSSSQLLELNDFIEAKPKSSLRKERFSGRIGLKVAKGDETYLLMSTHVITEAILSKFSLSGILNLRDRFDKLDDDWNEHVEIWAGNEKIGTIKQTFDPEAEHYPTGFKHDLTLIHPANSSVLTSITTPVSSLGWLARTSWASLRQRTSALKILGPTESHRASKTLCSSRPSEVLVVGEGIFLAQAASKPAREQPLSAWKDLVSRAVLYRVYPDFDPPTGYSGVALYAEGIREDGSEGPGVVGLQSFVQRSGHVQSFEMEGGALEKRLKMGRVAFYGAFVVPEELKEYVIV